MDRRSFMGIVLAGLATLAGFVVSSCVPLVGDTALNPKMGDPWRCTHCWHLFRSFDDMSGQKCPRCKKLELVRISEEEMQQHLKNAQGSK
jgi:phage FluMu protein Com